MEHRKVDYLNFDSIYCTDTLTIHSIGHLTTPKNIETLKKYI